MGVGREESQSRKEGKAEAIDDAVAPLTQFFISQLHQADKLGVMGKKGTIGTERGESGESNMGRKT